MKISFTPDADLTPAFNGHKFQVNKPWVFVCKGKINVVPAGFWTDFSSVGIFSPLDKTLYPALIHDWLYYSGKLNGKAVSRYRADEVFLQAMKFTKTWYMKRYTYYWGVRAGGWKPWNKYRKM